MGDKRAQAAARSDPRINRTPTEARAGGTDLPRPPSATTGAPKPRLQDNSDFRKLPRAYQKAVEGGKDLASVVADAKGRKEFGADAAAGGGLPRPPGGGGGGGGRRGPPGSGSNEVSIHNPGDEGENVESLIEKNFTDVLTGKLKRYSPEMMAQMKQGIFRSTIGADRGRELEAMRQGAVTGSFRSSTMQRRLQDIGTSSRQMYSQGIQKMMMEAAKAEWDDRNVALNQAQQWLDSKRKYKIGKMQIAATIESAHIQASATMGAAAIGADATKYAARASAGASRAASRESGRQFDESLADKQAQDNINNDFKQQAQTSRNLGL